MFDSVVKEAFATLCVALAVAVAAAVWHWEASCALRFKTSGIDGSKISVLASGGRINCWNMERCSMGYFDIGWTLRQISKIWLIGVAFFDLEEIGTG